MLTPSPPSLPVTLGESQVPVTDPPFLHLRNGAGSLHLPVWLWEVCENYMWAVPGTQEDLKTWDLGCQKLEAAAYILQIAH